MKIVQRLEVIYTQRNIKMKEEAANPALLKQVKNFFNFGLNDEMGLQPEDRFFEEQL